MLDTINQMLQATQDTGVNAQLRHSCAPGAGVLELDVYALQVLRAHYMLKAHTPHEPEPRRRPERPTLDERRPIE